MATGRELISEVRSNNKLTSADNQLTDRAIFAMLKSSASTLIKRETNLRRLWNSSNIFTIIECLEMEEVPLSECCDYQSTCKVSRSVHEIPEVAEGIFGLLIQYVSSPGLTQFDPVSLPRFVNLLKLQVKNTKKYFWIHNKRLYVTNPDVEVVNLSVFPEEDFDITTISACPSKKQLVDTCINPLDREFKIPSYLRKTLIDLVSETIGRTYSQHVADSTPNAQDTHR